MGSGAGHISIEYCSRQTIKSQVLTDFIAEWTDMLEPIPVEHPEHWRLYFDGALNIDGVEVGILLISPSGDELRYVLCIHFKASNNAAEYEADLHGIRIAISFGIKRLQVYSDSALVINQVNKDWSYTSDKMDAYCTEIRKLENKFYGIEFHHVVRDENTAADRLSKLGSTRAKVPAGVFVQDLTTPSITTTNEVQEQPPAKQLVMTVTATNDDDWRLAFINYLTKAEVPTDKVETECLIRRSKN